MKNINFPNSSTIQPPPANIGKGIVHNVDFTGKPEKQLSQTTSSAVPANRTIPVKNKDFTALYIFLGIVILLTAVVVFLRARKK